MFDIINIRIDRELASFIRSIDATFGLKRISPLLSAAIKDFIARPGKRLRPALFAVGYLGFAKHAPRNLYRSALSMELLHDFLLIHDDIIDRSDIRRGRPSMHRLLERYLAAPRAKPKFDGMDLATVVGDIVYAMAIHTFLAIDEDPARKETALRKFAETALFTASGEFIELLYSVKSMDAITEADIYKVYDLKTAHYSFASPLSIGAILAGAPEKEIATLTAYGIALGRAFQIKDDLLDMFAEESQTGKSPMTDLREAKKTLLVWQAYRKSGRKDKVYLRKALTKELLNKKDLERVRRIVLDSGSADHARRTIDDFKKTASLRLEASAIDSRYKIALGRYGEDLLKV